MACFSESQEKRVLYSSERNFENTKVGLQPKKQNHLALVFWVAVVLGILWLSN
ncbi:MAG: hypothetical protein ACJAS1_004833 [Oleiphilaceae bacterium]|jgi:hypothetical protein